MNKEIKYGFVPPPEDKKDFVLGGVFSLPKVALQPDGNWYPYLPLYEKQYGTNWDSYGCTVFGTQNALETILKRLQGGAYDFSERFNYNLIGIVPPGADPKQAAQSIHEYGVIEQKDLPYVDSASEFASPRPVTKDLIAKGHKWLEQYSFGYEFVYQNVMDKEKMREALKYSPLGVSVSAWYKNDSNEYYSPKGQSNNHWCVAFRIDEMDRVWVFDSYDQSVKILAKDHDIQFCIRYQVTTLKDVAVQVSFLSKLVQLLKDIFTIKLTVKKDIEEMEYVPIKDMETNQEKLLKTAQGALDTDPSPSDIAQDEFGCSETVCALIKRVFPDFGTYLSTAELFAALKRDKRFKATLTPTRGSVIVSPRTKDLNGHAGVFITDERIASNNSIGQSKGLFTGNYTFESWVNDFKFKKGLHVYIFELVG